MICVILRVWERWAAVADAKVICVSTLKDRAISLWKSGDARLACVPIEKFVFMTFLDHMFEAIQTERLVGRGSSYRTAMRSSAKLSEEDKDEIARAIELVRSADWAQLPPKFQAYECANRRWSKARAVYMRAAAAVMTARAEAKAGAANAAKANRDESNRKAQAATDGAAKLAMKTKRLTRRAKDALDADIKATAVMHVATVAHLESKSWETRELVAHRARLAVADAREARRRARARGRTLDPDDAAFASLVEEAETLMRRLRDEDDASRGFRSLGPAWRPFNM